MSSFYSNVTNEGDMLPNTYLLNQRLEPSVSVSYLNLLSGNSSNAHDHNDTEPMHQNSHYNGLCLSLGSQVPSLDNYPPDMDHYTNSNLCSMLNSHVVQNEGLKNVEYLSFDLSSRAQETTRYETMNNFQNTVKYSKDQISEIGMAFFNSKYIKAAQDLLDEVVSVHRTNSLSIKGQKGHSHDVKRDEFFPDLQESTFNQPNELSSSERQELQDKMKKLLTMLDEVDRRYKQYSYQMQVLVSSFDAAAGGGAARPYTGLALRTISGQFRTLRDAVKRQINDTQKRLGEQDSNSHGQGVLSRLRYVDQKLRQQKAVQQFGIMRQPWRPQRGLPETAVSVLRAWLFEHFLHPYPKDSEKTVLARQAGLTRSQVANWFINARVRLWKPMIEDIYKEEFGDAETEHLSPPENAPDSRENYSLYEKEEDFPGSLISAPGDGNLSSLIMGNNNEPLSLFDRNSEF